MNALVPCHSSARPARHGQRPQARSATLLALAALSLSAASAQAGTKSLSAWTDLYQGVSFARGAETNVLYPGEASARTLAVQVLRVNLDAPGLQLFTTPSNGSTNLDTNGQTTGAFLQQYGLQVAVNAGFFSPCCAASAQPKDVIGLAISQGVLVSPADGGAIPPGGTADSLVFESDNDAAIVKVNPGDDVSAYYNAVSAGPVLLRDGVNLMTEVPPNSFSNQNPRTAAGLSADGNTLWLLTIDGRQPGYSDGATLWETGDWLQWLGADDGLNLDGGGSTTMVAADATAALGYTVLNHPSSTNGAQRYNGNNLGIYALPVPEASTHAMLAAGLLALGWLGARRRG